MKWKPKNEVAGREAGYGAKETAELVVKGPL